MSKFKYTKEDVLREMAEALNVKEPQKAKPNIIQKMLAQRQLGKAKER